MTKPLNLTRNANYVFQHEEDSNHCPINKSPICACITYFKWYIIYVLQYQVFILYGKQSKIVNELQVMKSNELQIEQRTYLDKLMLSTVGKQWLMD